MIDDARPLKIESVQTVEAKFDALYAHFSEMCRDEGIEPLSPRDLLHVLWIVATVDDASEHATRH